MVTEKAIVLAKPEHIEHWVFLSRLHQLALQTKFPTMRHRIGPITKVLYLEGWIDEMNNNTITWKAQVLYAMVNKLKEIDPQWPGSKTIDLALAPFDENLLKRGKVTINYPRAKR